MAALLLTPAAAESSTPWEHTCTGVHGVAWDTQIENCTAVIEARQEPPVRLAVAYHHRGRAWRFKREYDRAVADFTEAIKLNPKSGELYRDRGGALFDAGQFARAIADFDEIVRREPENRDAHRMRGRIWLAAGEFDRAIADFGETIRLDPDDPDAHSERGRAWLATGKFDRAIADFTQAIRFNGPSWSYLYDRGRAYYMRGSFAVAAADFHRSVALSPQRRTSRNSSRFIVDDHAAFRFFARLRARAEKKAHAELAAFRWRGDRELYALLLGRGSPKAVFDNDLEPGSRCRNEHFVGQWRLVRGELQAARQRLQAAAIEECKELFTEFRQAALVELRRMRP
jgi:tetratricopeptide (TPR) repeat protein